MSSRLHFQFAARYQTLTTWTGLMHFRHNSVAQNTFVSIQVKWNMFSNTNLIQLDKNPVESSLCWTLLILLPCDIGLRDAPVHLQITYMWKAGLQWMQKWWSLANKMFYQTVFHSSIKWHRLLTFIDNFNIKSSALQCSTCVFAILVIDFLWNTLATIVTIYNPQFQT